MIICYLPLDTFPIKLWTRYICTVYLYIINFMSTIHSYSHSHSYTHIHTHMDIHIYIHTCTRNTYTLHHIKFNFIHFFAEILIPKKNLSYTYIHTYIHTLSYGLFFFKFVVFSSNFIKFFD